MKIGFYAGSFDPFTNGHLHVLKKSLQLFDSVIIGIGTNPEKIRRFDKKIMKEAIENLITNHQFSNASVITYDGLSVDAAIEHNATFLVRGIRNGMDYAEEENLAAVNEEICNLDTIYIRAGHLGTISSSMVMSLLQSGRDVSHYLPKEILEVVKKDFRVF